MPIGVIINALAVVIGGLLGNVAGQRLSDTFKEKLTTIFGACAMTMGIGSMMKTQNMPVVILAVIAGTIIGLNIRLDGKITAGARQLEKMITKITGPRTQDSDSDLSRSDYESMLITMIVLFCASGTGIYGSMVSGMTGDHSILIAKSIMDLPTSMLFACELGIIVSFIAIPQCLIFLCLFFMANAIFPYCTPTMIGDFTACGGVLLLATGFRMINVKQFPIADMIPAMVVVMPISAFWTSVVLQYVK